MTAKNYSRLAALIFAIVDRVLACPLRVKS